MKRILSIFGLFAIVLNSAMGVTGTLLFCEHAAGDFHLVSQVAHSGEAHQLSCHSDGSLSLTARPCIDDCDSCIDTELGGSDGQDLQRNSSQDRVPNPQVVAVELSRFDFAELLAPVVVGRLPLTRAPPEVESLTALQVKNTVLRL